MCNNISIIPTCVASGCTGTWLGWASLDSEWTAKLTKIGDHENQ